MGDLYTAKQPGSDMAETMENHAGMETAEALGRSSEEAAEPAERNDITQEKPDTGAVRQKALADKDQEESKQSLVFCILVAVTVILGLVFLWNLVQL